MKRFLATLVILPPLILGFFILKYWVNIPIGDEWDTPTTALIQASQKQLSFEHLLSQHNESRLFFPRLLFLGLLYLTHHWDPRQGMLISFLLACFISLAVYRLSNFTLKANSITKLFCLFVANLLIFSPMQAENWLWGLQVITLVPIASITISLALIFSKANLPTKVLASIVLSTISTFSYANGILAWIIIFPSLLMYVIKNTKNWKWVISGWLACFAVNLALYFYNYYKPSYHPSFSEALIHPKQAIVYFLSFLGNSLGAFNFSVNQGVGLTLIILFSFSVLYFIFSIKNLELTYRLLPWLSIGAYSIISALITTLGRLGFGVEQSLSARYVTFAIYLPVALIYLVIIIIDNLKSKVNVINPENFYRLVTFLLGSLMTLHFISFGTGVKLMSEMTHNRIYAKGCLLFTNVLKDSSCFSSLYPVPKHLKSQANQLNEFNILPFSLITTAKMQDLIDEKEQAVGIAGVFDTLASDVQGNYNASGWAVIPKQNKPADIVVLAYKTANSSDMSFTIAKVNQSRKDVAEVFQNPSFTNSGWSISFAKSLIHLDSQEISAWAFDTTTLKAYKLANTHRL